MTKEQLCKNLGVCNCGDPRATVLWIRDAFNLVAEKLPNIPVGPRHQHLRQTWCDAWKRRLDTHFGCDAAFLFFVNWMNNEGYAEHGSMVGGSWLTPAGKEILAWMNQELENEDWDD